MINMQQWELGSDFSWDVFSTTDGIKNILFQKDCTFFGTGRCALKLLIKLGIDRYNWEHIWVPSYYCPDVIDSIEVTGIKIKYYFDDPLHPLKIDTLSTDRNCSIVINNLFGYRTKPDYSSLNRENIHVIEDHSHDPWSDWSLSSDADWCFGSLRKTLPISDGGILWSPKRHKLPIQPKVTINHLNASLQKYVGMLLKSDYLKGASIEKEYYRKFLISGEKKLGIGAISGITYFSFQQMIKTPITLLREKKLINYKHLYDGIKHLPKIRLLEPGINKNLCPFSVIMYFESSTYRNSIYESLIQENIYPAVLWPIEKYPKYRDINLENIRFSARMLSIPIDYRYNNTDIDRVTEIISKLIRKT